MFKTPEEAHALVGTTVGHNSEQYFIDSVLGHGCFGVVFAATNTLTKKRAAVKLGLSDASGLAIEKHILSLFLPEFPGLRYSGDIMQHQYIVTDLLGPSLQDLSAGQKNKFSLKTICLIGYQLVCRLETLHFSGFIHRDVKPTNVLIGTTPQDRHTLYLIDFGLSTSYIDGTTRSMLPFARSNRCVGSFRFMSRHAQRGFRQSPRDDLESLGYVLVFLARGSLPWQKRLLKLSFPEEVQNPTSYKKLILKCKEQLSIQSLCHGLPYEIQKFISYTRGLAYDEQPHYGFMKNLFLQCLKRHGYSYDLLFDWLLPKVSSGIEDDLDRLSIPQPNGNRSIPRLVVT